MKAQHDEGILRSFAWVIMPDHVHCLFGLNDVFTLAQTMQRFKARSAKGVNCYLKRSGLVW